MKKNRIIQTVLIAVFALCTLFSAFVSVLACIPLSTDVEIAQMVHASASRLSAGLNPDYEVDVTGALRNTTGNALLVERLEIPLETENGDPTRTVVIENIILPPRSTEYLPLTREVMNGAYVKVGDITATVNGETMFLRNPADVSLTFSLIPIVITLVFGFLLVRACKVRYYMYQEDRADAQEWPVSGDAQTPDKTES